jgi:hypothetical protein
MPVTHPSLSKITREGSEETFGMVFGGRKEEKKEEKKSR